MVPNIESRDVRCVVTRRYNPLLKTLRFQKMRSKDSEIHPIQNMHRFFDAVANTVYSVLMFVVCITSTSIMGKICFE